MKSFIFNNFKERLLTGAIKAQDTWTFKFVNDKFVKDFKDNKLMPSYTSQMMFKFGHMLPNEPVYNNELLNKYWVNCCPVYYTYKKAVNTENAEKPTFVDNNNWDEFIKLFPKNKHLKKLFLEEGGTYARTYESDELDENENPVIKFRGFYYVRTSEELRWCADKVNGNLNGIISDKIYNDQINIVLGDNIGTENPQDLGKNKIINYCIGESVEHPFNGVFFGNGFIIKNVRILCQGNNNGIIGVLGPTGIISTVRVEGNNILACKKDISITHLQNDAVDVNSAVLCGLNRGLIMNSYIRGRVYLKGFIPKVYAVQNRTDSGGAFDCPESNRFYPSYLCINSISNIIPYIGYFAEGVFASIASEEDIAWTRYTKATGGKAYWKSNGVSCGAVGLYTGTAERNEYYPYDNSSCSEWAYPSINQDTGSIADMPITGHVLYYDINSMIWTQKEMGKEQSDWAEYLGLVCRRDKKYSTGWGAYTYEIGASQIVDKSIKMHPFNRIAYYSGLFAGQNSGRIWNVRADATVKFRGTFVGFFGSLAGKWNARPHNWSSIVAEIAEVAMNVTVSDDNSRSYWVSDTGDSFKTDGNSEGWNFYSNSFYDPLSNTYPTLANAHKLCTNIDDVNDYRKEVNPNYYYDAPRSMGSGYGNRATTNVQNDVDYGNNPVIRFNLQDVKWNNLAATAGTDNDTAVRMKTFSVDSSKKTDARNVAIYSSYETLKSYITGSESEDYIVSAVELSGSFYATGYARPSKPNSIADAAGIMWRDRHDKITDGFYASQENDNEIQVIHSSTFTTNSATNNFVVTNVDFKIESLARVNTRGNYGGTDDNMRLLPEYDKFFSFPFGMVNLHYKDSATPIAGYVTSVNVGELEVTCDCQSYSVPQRGEAYNAYGSLYTYSTYSIKEARNVTFTVYSVDNTDKVIKFTIPVMTNQQMFTNRGQDSRAPAISFLQSRRYVDGNKNYHIMKRSIKNIGGVFGSVVLGSDLPCPYTCTMSNVSAYLYNADAIEFKKTANMFCDKFQAEVDKNWFASANGFSADSNFSQYSADNVYFKVSGDPADNDPGHPCLLKYTNNKCGAQVDFPIYPGMEIASMSGQLMYRFDDYKIPVNTNDYYFANRYGGFAAVCEIDSSNIGDKDVKDLRNNIEITSKYINFVNTNFIYNENRRDETFKGFMYSTFAEGPMRLQYQAPYECPYGVALPFIAEVKPHCISIPTIIECPLSNLPSEHDSSFVNDADDAKLEWKYKRIGLYNNDICLANPGSDPNFYSHNIVVDLPGVRNRIMLNDMDNGNVSSCDTWTVNYASFEDSLLDKLFVFTDMKLGICNMGSSHTGSTSASQGYGWNQGVYATYPNNWHPSYGRTPTSPASDPDAVVYSDSKLLNAWEYFGSDLLLKQYPYQGHAPNTWYNIAVYNHPKAIGEFCNHLNYMVSTKTFPLIENKPFNVQKNMYRDCLQMNAIGIKGNMKQADLAASWSGTDVFKYNFTKKPAFNQQFNSITRTVDLTEIDGQYGFYIKDYVSDIQYPGNSALSGYKYHTHTSDGLGNLHYQYDDDGNLMYDRYGKPLLDGFDYDGRVFHIGMQISELCIMNNLKEYNKVVASGISSTSAFEGMLVFDSEQHPVMYIDVGLGECDGSQSWAMPCSGIPGGPGLFLEIK